MIKTSQNKIRSAQVKIIVLAVLLCFAAAPILALYSPANLCQEHSPHEIDLSCKACALAKNIIRQTAACVKYIAFTLAVIFLLALALCIMSPWDKTQTPVSLKIRINN